jgi:YjbE family integral membrane protein
MITEQLSSILQIIFADIILSGDNALIIGMAASGLPPNLRKKAIFMGMALAAFFRIFFAAIASILLNIPGILFFGGLLLFFVCWRFYKELKDKMSETEEESSNQKTYKGSPAKQLFNALVTITIADVSMSIDNVVAVAAIAREDTHLLIFGLVLAIMFMAFFATIIMNILTRFRWLSWLGLIFLVYLSTKMVIDGLPEIFELFVTL